MFTGLVETVGSVAHIARRQRDARITLRTGTIPAHALQLGDSVAISGVCLTVVEVTADGFVADASAETLSCTTLGEWSVGSRVNLERALLPTTRLGGHLVSGHIDGVGVVQSIETVGTSRVMTFAVPPTLSRYVAAKGSICIDGVSLTVNRVQQDTFEVNIIAHTAAVTTLGDYTPGRRVNIEVDLLARYVERLLQSEPGDSNKGITADFLAAHGYAAPVKDPNHG